MPFGSVDQVLIPADEPVDAVTPDRSGPGAYADLGTYTIHPEISDAWRAWGLYLFGRDDLWFVTITITDEDPYTLSVPFSDPTQMPRFEYSFDGGGTWLSSTSLRTGNLFFFGGTLNYDEVDHPPEVTEVSFRLSNAWDTLNFFSIPHYYYGISMYLTSPVPTEDTEIIGQSGLYMGIDMLAYGQVSTALRTGRSYVSMVG